MKIKMSLLMGILLCLLSCGSNDKPVDELLGKWNMHLIYDAEVDVTARHNPNSNRWILFSADGSFESDGDPYGRNTGKWHLDSEKSILSIDSDTENDDSQWHISFKDHTCTWTGIGSPRKEGFRLIYHRDGH